MSDDKSFLEKLGVSGVTSGNESPLLSILGELEASTSNNVQGSTSSQTALDLSLILPMDISVSNGDSSTATNTMTSIPLDADIDQLMKSLGDDVKSSSVSNAEIDKLLGSIGVDLSTDVSFPSSSTAATVDSANTASVSTNQDDTLRALTRDLGIDLSVPATISQTSPPSLLSAGSNTTTGSAQIPVKASSGFVSASIHSSPQSTSSFISRTQPHQFGSGTSHRPQSIVMSSTPVSPALVGVGSTQSQRSGSMSVISGAPIEKAHSRTETASENTLQGTNMLSGSVTPSNIIQQFSTSQNISQSLFGSKPSQSQHSSQMTYSSSGQSFHGHRSASTNSMRPTQQMIVSNAAPTIPLTRPLATKTTPTARPRQPNNQSVVSVGATQRPLSFTENTRNNSPAPQIHPARPQQQQSLLNVASPQSTARPQIRPHARPQAKSQSSSNSPQQGQSDPLAMLTTMMSRLPTDRQERLADLFRGLQSGSIDQHTFLQEAQAVLGSKLKDLLAFTQQQQRGTRHLNAGQAQVMNRQQPIQQQRQPTQQRPRVATQPQIQADTLGYQQGTISLQQSPLPATIGRAQPPILTSSSSSSPNIASPLATTASENNPSIPLMQQLLMNQQQHSVTTQSSPNGNTTHLNSMNLGNIVPLSLSPTSPSLPASLRHTGLREQMQATSSNTANIDNSQSRPNDTSLPRTSVQSEFNDTILRWRQIIQSPNLSGEQLARLSMQLSAYTEHLANPASGSSSIPDNERSQIFLQLTKLQGLIAQRQFSRPPASGLPTSPPQPSTSSAKPEKKGKEPKKKTNSSRNPKDNTYLSKGKKRTAESRKTGSPTPRSNTKKQKTIDAKGKGGASGNSDAKEPDIEGFAASLGLAGSSLSLDSISSINDASGESQSNSNKSIFAIMSASQVSSSGPELYVDIDSIPERPIIKHAPNKPNIAASGDASEVDSQTEGESSKSGKGDARPKKAKTKPKAKAKTKPKSKDKGTDNDRDKDKAKDKGKDMATDSGGGLKAKAAGKAKGTDGKGASGMAASEKNEIKTEDSPVNAVAKDTEEARSKERETAETKDKDEKSKEKEKDKDVSRKSKEKREKDKVGMNSGTSGGGGGGGGSSDIFSIDDVIGYTGVDLREESEVVLGSGGSSKTQSDGQGDGSGEADDNTPFITSVTIDCVEIARDKAFSVEFADQSVLEMIVAAVCKKAHIRKISSDVASYLSCALQDRLRSFMELVSAAAYHRTRTQTLPPPPLDPLTKLPLYKITPHQDTKKQLLVLERVDRLREERRREELEAREQRNILELQQPANPQIQDQAGSDQQQAQSSTDDSMLLSDASKINGGNAASLASRTETPKTPNAAAAHGNDGADKQAIQEDPEPHQSHHSSQNLGSRDAGDASKQHPAKRYRKKDDGNEFSAYTSKNMPDDVRNRISNQTALRAAGGIRKSWMNASTPDWLVNASAAKKSARANANGGSGSGLRPSQSALSLDMPESGPAKPSDVHRANSAMFTSLDAISPLQTASPHSAETGDRSPNIGSGDGGPFSDVTSSTGMLRGHKRQRSSVGSAIEAGGIQSDANRNSSGISTPVTLPSGPPRTPDPLALRYPHQSTLLPHRTTALAVPLVVTVRDCLFSLERERQSNVRVARGGGERVLIQAYAKYLHD